MSGSVRVAASKMRRLMMAHPPPVMWPSISQTRLPTARPVVKKKATRYERKNWTGPPTMNERTADSSRKATPTKSARCR